MTDAEIRKLRAALDSYGNGKAVRVQLTKVELLALLDRLDAEERLRLALVRKALKQQQWITRWIKIARKLKGG